MQHQAWRWLVRACLAISCIQAALVSAEVTLDDIPSPGSYEAQAEAEDQRRVVCTFHIAGSPPSDGSGEVAAASIDPGASELSYARAACTGGAQPVEIIGGPALAPFAEKFQGIDFRQQIELPGASMQLRGVDLDIEASTFDGLQARGLAVLSFSASNVTFRNCSFSDGSNSAAGAIYANESSEVTILDSVFRNNVGGQGGAVTVWNSSVLVNGTTFSGNIGDGQGGGLAAFNASTFVLLDSNFTENSANNGGGAYVEECGSSVFAGNTFLGNKAEHSGGGLFQIRCSGELQGNMFEKNQGTNGAAVWQNDCEKVTHTDNHFLSNVAEAGSGALELNQGGVSVAMCTFTKGKGQKGGGIYMQDIQGDISDSVFEGNSVEQFGGAIFRGTSQGDIYGCEFLGNSAKKSGAAIYDSHVVGDIGANKFSKNKAGGDGSIIFRTESQGRVKSDNRGLPDTENAVHIDNNVDSTGENSNT